MSAFLAWSLHPANSYLVGVIIGLAVGIYMTRRFYTLRDKGE